MCALNDTTNINDKRFRKRLPAYWNRWATLENETQCITVRRTGCKLVTARNVVAAKLCFPRCLWFCSQGVGGAKQPPPLGRHPQAFTPPRLTPPFWADTPLPRQPPSLWADTRPAQCMLGYTPPAQCILGYTPPGRCMLGYSPPPRATTAVDGTHPTGMQASCLKNHALMKHVINVYNAS